MFLAIPGFGEMVNPKGRQFARCGKRSSTGTGMKPATAINSMHARASTPSFRLPLLKGESRRAIQQALSYQHRRSMNSDGYEERRTTDCPQPLQLPFLFP